MLLFAGVLLESAPGFRSRNSNFASASSSESPACLRKRSAKGPLDSRRYGALLNGVFVVVLPSTCVRTFTAPSNSKCQPMARRKMSRKSFVKPFMLSQRPTSRKRQRRPSLALRASFQDPLNYVARFQYHPVQDLTQGAILRLRATARRRRRDALRNTRSPYQRQG